MLSPLDLTSVVRRKVNGLMGFRFLYLLRKLNRELGLKSIEEKTPTGHRLSKNDNGHAPFNKKNSFEVQKFTTT